MRSLRTALALVSTLALVTAALALTAAPASAAVGYAPTAAFGSGGSGDAQFSLNPEPAAPGAGAAVDAASGDVYVVDTFNNRIEKFDSSGNFLAAWGWGVTDSAQASEVCTSACQAGIAGSGEGQFNTPVGVAVDNTVGPNAGDVYVTDRENHRIEQFSSSGAYLSQFGSGIFKGGNSIAVDPTDGNVWVGDTSIASAVAYSPADGSVQNTISINGGSGIPFALAVGPSGNVYVIDGSIGVVRRYDPTGAELGNFAGGSGGIGPRSIAIDASGDVFVGNGTTEQITRYDASGDVEANGFGPPAVALPTGLATDPAGDTVYVVDGPQNAVEVFSEVIIPTPTTAPASGIEEAAATLNGEVNPEGIELTECAFEWGKTTGYGETAQCVPNAAAIGHGISPVPVQASIGSLEPGTAYHYRLFAENENGAERGSDQTLTTTAGAPTATTEPASGIGIHAVTLPATVDPRGAPTNPGAGAPAGSHCQLQYLTEHEYEENGNSFSGGHAPSTAECEPDPSGANATTAVSVHVEGLTAATAYEFRVELTTAGGSADGVAALFTTKPIPTYPLTVTTEGTGSGEVRCDTGSGPEACSAEYEEGTHVILTAVPGVHSAFDHWGGECSGAGACEVTMTAPISVSATFPLTSHTVKAKVEGKGSIAAATGTISGCTEAAGACEGPYEETREVTLTATPAENQQIAVWTGCTSTPQGPTGNECKLTVGAANAEVAVRFAPIMRKLTTTLAGTGTGSLTCNGSACASEYEQGSKLTLAATPASGSTFAGWSGAGCSGTADCSVTIDTDTALTATFNANPKAEEHKPPLPEEPSNKIAIGAAKLQGSNIGVKVTVPGPGSLTASAKNLKGARMNLNAGGTVTLRLSLTSAGQKALKKAKAHKLKLKVTFVFTPDGGRPATATKTITFEAKGQAQQAQVGAQEPTSMTSSIKATRLAPTGALA